MVVVYSRGMVKRMDDKKKLNKNSKNINFKIDAWMFMHVGAVERCGGQGS